MLRSFTRESPQGCLTECEYFLKRGVLILCLVHFKHRSVTFVYLSIICVRDIFQMKRSNLENSTTAHTVFKLTVTLTDFGQAVSVELNDLTRASNFD